MEAEGVDGLNAGKLGRGRAVASKKASGEDGSREASDEDEVDGWREAACDEMDGWREAACDEMDGWKFAGDEVDGDDALLAVEGFS